MERVRRKKSLQKFESKCEEVGLRKMWRMHSICNDRKRTFFADGSSGCGSDGGGGGGIVVVVVMVLVVMVVMVLVVMVVWWR